MAISANQYHMAYRIVDVTLPRNLHDIDRISAEVNTALDQYKTKFSAKLALIVSWRMTSAAGDVSEMVNKYYFTLRYSLSETITHSDIV